jgi:glycine/D-amino acid oxidase-like deaminating enzyme
MHSTPNTYDYIIIGGGSTGCCLANRLSAAAGPKGAGSESRPSRLLLGYLYSYARWADVGEPPGSSRAAI